MRLYPVNFMIAVAMSAMIAYWLWSLDGILKNFVVVGSFVFLTGTLVPCMGINFERARNAANLRIVCSVFFMIGAALNIAFSFIVISQTAYILINAITFLIYIFIANVVYNAKQ